MEIFWKTIAYYNSATWIYQLLIIVALPAVDSDAYKESPSVGKDGHEAIYDFSVFVDCYRILCHLL